VYGRSGRSAQSVQQPLLPQTESLGGMIRLMRYYRFRWNEPPSDHPSWGPSTWYVAVGDSSMIVSQWEVYENGVVLQYDRDHLRDEYGMLADQLFDPREAASEGVEELGREDYKAATSSLTRRPPGP
jgi:hypothetical protein